MLNKRKKPTQQIPQYRASCTAVPVVYGKRRFLPAAVLLAVVLCVAVIPVLRDAVSGLIMLFAQKSVHTLAGALRAQGWLCVPYAFLLAAFRAVVLPWLPPLFTLASRLVFGDGLGFFVAAASSAAGGSVCFLLSRLVLRPFTARLKRPGSAQGFSRWGGVLCCVLLLLSPGSIGFAGYLFGMTSVSFRRFLGGVAVGESAVIFAYFVCCSPYKTLLPKTARVALAALGLVFLLLYAFWLYRKKKSGNF